MRDTTIMGPPRHSVQLINSVARQALWYRTLLLTTEGVICPLFLAYARYSGAVGSLSAAPREASALVKGVGRSIPNLTCMSFGGRKLGYPEEMHGKTCQLIQLGCDSANHHATMPPIVPGSQVPVWVQVVKQ